MTTKATPRQLSDAAEEYCRRGMFVIPANHPIQLADGSWTCSCGTQHAPGKQGKHPAVGWKRFQDKCPDLRQVRVWFGSRFSGYNIACIHGASSGTILLDFDGLEGYATQRQLERELGELPPTWTTITGGNGSHMYYNHPGVFVPTNKNLRPCFDVRGDGGISVLPPSHHEFGVYQWECDLSPDDIDLADLPQTWIDFITVSVSVSTSNTSSNISAVNSPAMTNVQWQSAPDGTILIHDGREDFMRRTVWGTLLDMLQETGFAPTADDLFARAAQNYMPYVDTTKPGRGLDELAVKCKAAIAKVQRVKLTARGLSRPFLGIAATGQRIQPPQAAE